MSQRAASKPLPPSIALIRRAVPLVNSSGGGKTGDGDDNDNNKIITFPFPWKIIGLGLGMCVV